MKIAVIGSGMAGLTVARLLFESGYSVTIYESAPHRGMDAHAIKVTDPNGDGIVDMPLRVMSNKGWRTVLALSQHYGINTYRVTTPVSLSWLNQETWFRSGHFQIAGRNLPTIGSPFYLNRASVLIVKNLWRLHREPETAFKNKTLEEFFSENRYDDMFWRGLILPLLSTISTCTYEHLLRYPAEDLLKMVQDLIFQASLYRLQGGTRALVDKLASGLTFISGKRVSLVSLKENKVLVKNEAGNQSEFDYVVVATQANQTSFLGSEFAAERSLLESFVFDRGELVLHRDQRVMPVQRKNWTVLSYLMDQNFRQAMFSVWVNPVEPSLTPCEPIFQTWNPLIPIEAKNIISSIHLDRAVVTKSTLAAQHQLLEMTNQPDRRVFFCGSWSYPGIPLLESAARSGIRVAKRLGAKLPPFCSLEPTNTEHRHSSN